MKKIKNQNGVVSAIGVFILIVVISSMVIVALNMSRSSLSDSNQKSSKTQAMYLAESALERVIFSLNSDPNCNNLVPPDQQTLGGDTFEFSIIAINDSTVDCDIKVKASVNGIIYYIDAKVINNTFVEPFDYADNNDFDNTWTDIPTGGTEGFTSLGDQNCDSAATCPTPVGAPVGLSAYIATTGSGGNRDMQGYLTRDIPKIVTPAGGMNIDLTGGFYKRSSDGLLPSRQRLYIELVDSTTGDVTEIWADLSTSGGGAGLFTAINVANFNLPGDRIYDQLRIRYNFRGTSTGGGGGMGGGMGGMGGGTYQHPQAYIDEIVISRSDNEDWQVTEWQEVGS